MIDLQRNLSAEEHLILYWYSIVVEKSNVSYDDFRITESLIMRFNEYVKKWNTAFFNNPLRFEKPVDWDRNRTKTDYFRNQLAKGHEFEIWVQRKFKSCGVDIGGYNSEKGQFAGENNLGIEIKYDMRHAETGNIYIEYCERLDSSKNWIKSGILKNDNTKYWLIGNMNDYFIFTKITLVNIYNKLIRKENIKGCHLVEEKLNGTSKGFVMNNAFSRTVTFADSIEDFVGKLNIDTNISYYALNMFVHGRRECRYIRNKPDNMIKVFDSLDDALKAGFQKCNNPNCFL